MKYPYNIFITYLIRNGYSVLAVDFDGELKYFVTKDWTPAHRNSVETFDFNMFTGYEVTDFSAQTRLAITESQFMSTFNVKYDKAEFFTMKFSKDISWTYWE